MLTKFSFFCKNFNYNLARFVTLIYKNKLYFLLS